jgi:hypothetical protein
MTESAQDVDRLVAEVRTRLNLALGLDLLVKGLCAAGSLLMAVALAGLAAGWRIPPAGCAAVLALALAALFCRWWRSRRSLEDAAIHIDSQFGLKDSVRSYLGFSQAGQRGEIYDLQADQTRLALDGVSAQQIKTRWPIRGTLVCTALAVSLLWLTLRTSPPAMGRPAAAAESAPVDANQINRQIKAALEQIQEQIRADRIETKMPIEDIQKVAADLKTPASLKDALRQYSQIETRLDRLHSRIEQRREEQAYQKMGQALQRQGPAKALSEALVQRQYREAGQELARLKIDKAASAERKAEQVEQLKAVSQRMADEARQQTTPSKAADLARRLDKAASDLGRSLGTSGKGSSNQASKGAARGQQGAGSQGSRSQASASQGTGAAAAGADDTASSGGDQAEAGVNGCLDEMAGHLGDLDAQSKTRSAIQELCRSLSESQAKMCDKSGEGKGEGEGKGSCSGDGSGNSPGGDGSGDGGLPPGTGSSSRVNTGKDGAVTTGQRSVLKGIQGQGPSVNTTEAATDGSGSRLGSTGMALQQYRHQAEAFVRREDVSEAVKSGVKAYFENIHKDASPGGR